MILIHPNAKNIVGNRYGRLVVVEPTNERKNSRIVYKCKCDCGKDHLTTSDCLIAGKSKSCGCRYNSRSKNHGLTGTPEFNSWQGMKYRCTPTAHCHSDYFDRGIKVADEWKGRNGFQNFLNHVGKKPSLQHSLDRIDNDGNYEQGNVRWATRSEQSKNRRAYKSIENFTTKELLDELNRRGIMPK
jgi:hypothetical protein